MTANDIRPVHCDIPMRKWGFVRSSRKQIWRCVACGWTTVNPAGKQRKAKSEVNREYYLRKLRKRKNND
jgi:ribosomal protein L37AE/L43A